MKYGFANGGLLNLNAGSPPPGDLVLHVYSTAWTTPHDVIRDVEYNVTVLDTEGRWRTGTDIGGYPAYRYHVPTTANYLILTTHRAAAGNANRKFNIDTFSSLTTRVTAASVQTRSPYTAYYGKSGLLLYAGTSGQYLAIRRNSISAAVYYGLGQCDLKIYRLENAA